MLTRKEHATKLVDEKSGLVECLVCREKYTPRRNLARTGISFPGTGSA